MSKLNGIKILVVDDEDALRDILVDEFECEGAEAESAEHGKDAIEKLQEAKFDFVITDVRMPVMDGVELLKLIVQKFGEQRPKVILLSGYTDVSQLEAIEFGAIDLLEKPWDMDHLIERIKENI
ncbi:MAG: response regulator [Bdellovibrionota bacterium]|nr:response regulator [Pseudobdellovibrionaceae bacterium]|tara:strand:+ start:15738 stop:16109 length:372 start_codon:yes stop_codon:yes gene_type:complete